MEELNYPVPITTAAKPEQLLVTTLEPNTLETILTLLQQQNQMIKSMQGQINSLVKEVTQLRKATN